MMIYAPVLLVLSLVSSPIAQSSAELKLKLREDETVQFRSVLSVATYSPDKIDERVMNSLIAFTFSGEKDGRIPVKAVIEEFEDMDTKNGNERGGFKAMNMNFTVDKKGDASVSKHATSIPALEAFAPFITRTLDGMNSTGFLGLKMPEKAVAVGEKWTMKVDAREFMATALAPIESAFAVTGTYNVTFTLVDLINVNNAPHARIEVSVEGNSEIAIDTAEFNAGGTLTVNSASSVLLDLATGLITRSKTDTSAELDLGVANAQIVISHLLYRV